VQRFELFNMFSSNKSPEDEVIFGKKSEDLQIINTDENRIINSQVNYMKSSSNFVVAHFILQCCKRLEAKCITTATAASLYHKFFMKADITKYDPYLIAASSIYLAGKVENDQLRLRDVINTVHSTLHNTMDTLPLSDKYWNMRDAIVQAELFLLRMVEFRVESKHAHKYLLHYLSSVRDWMQEQDWNMFPIPRTAWGILQDLYHDNYVVTCDPSILALGVLQLTLQIYGLELPYLNSMESDQPWFKAFNSQATKENIWDVMKVIIQVYNKEKDELEPLTVQLVKTEQTNKSR